ncbi:MAG: flagellar basal body P-ring formation protein FlgA [Bdellovibrionales bacterium]|nr:flagellar basal body P-ring formation protein FlgA [Bdellovibrionales bacterium]
MNKVYLFALAFLYALAALVGASSAAEASPREKSSRTIKVVGKKESTVTKKAIHLTDVANISSKYVRDDEALIALKKIELGASPLPGKPTTFTAAQILEKMRESGVDLQAIGYAFPRTMKVSRAARAITKDEVNTIVLAALSESGRDIELVDVGYQEDALVVPGITELEAEIFHSPRPNQLSVAITANVEDEKPVTFHVKATVKEWATIPVANRPLYQGNIVGAGDVVMARMNLAELPQDAARDTKSIIGYATKRHIAYGEIFRKNKLQIPPLVEAGAKVTVRYRTKYLEATASGIALEAGIEGQRIRVRNEQSKKTVFGTVLHSGLVEVER